MCLKIRERHLPDVLYHTQSYSVHFKIKKKNNNLKKKVCFFFNSNLPLILEHPYRSEFSYDDLFSSNQVPFHIRFVWMSLFSELHTMFIKTTQIYFTSEIYLTEFINARVWIFVCFNHTFTDRYHILEQYISNFSFQKYGGKQPPLFKLQC